MADADKVLRRARLVAGLNGWSVVIGGAVCVVLTAALGGGWWALLGLGVAASGVMELAGRRALPGSPAEARRWLTLSQLWLLGLIILYCLYQIGSLDLDALVARVRGAMDVQSFKDLGLDEQSLRGMIRRAWYALYISVIVASLIYQGGLCLYYRRSVAKLCRPRAPSPGDQRA